MLKLVKQNAKSKGAVKIPDLVVSFSEFWEFIFYMRNNSSRKFPSSNFIFYFVIHCSHPDVLNTAGSDVVEPRECFICNINGKSMHGDPFLNSHSYRCKFPVSWPDTSKTIFDRSIDAKILTSLDECAFNSMDESVQVFTEISKMNNDIADKLTWSVISSLSAAIYIYLRMRKLIGVKKRAFLLSSAYRLYGRMF